MIVPFQSQHVFSRGKEIKTNTVINAELKNIDVSQTEEPPKIPEKIILDWEAGTSSALGLSSEVKLLTSNFFICL